MKLFNIFTTLYFASVLLTSCSSDTPDLTEDPDTIEAIEDFKKRYTQKVTLPHEIMLEDWLLLVRVFFLMNSDLMQVSQGAIQGFEQLLLDSIYNDGKLQELHQNMNKDVKRFFNGYDKVFTLNYDNNIESLTHKNVYHLHGDFSVLSNTIFAKSLVFQRKNTACCGTGCSIRA